MNMDELKDYSVGDLKDDMTAQSSILNNKPFDSQFIDSIAIDQSIEGVYPTGMPLGSLGFLGSQTNTSFTVSSGNTLYNHPQAAQFAIISWSQDGDQPMAQGAFFIAKSGATTLQVRGDTGGAGANWVYTFAWQTKGIRITETTDASAAHSITGTIYWYR